MAARLQIPSLPTGDQQRVAEQAYETQSSKNMTRGQMFDFRISKNSVRFPHQELKKSMDRMDRKVLEPIAENQNAHISHLYSGMPQLPRVRDQVNSSASTLTELSQVDNGILFLDNYSKIVNPRGMPTPPPPLWGTLLEEDNYDASEPFYNHEKARAEMSRRRKTEELKKPFSSQNATT